MKPLVKASTGQMQHQEGQPLGLPVLVPEGGLQSQVCDDLWQSTTVVLQPQWAKNDLESMLEMIFSGFSPRDSESVGPGGAWNFALLTCSKATGLWSTLWGMLVTPSLHSWGNRNQVPRPMGSPLSRTGTMAPWSAQSSSTFLLPHCGCQGIWGRCELEGPCSENCHCWGGRIDYTLQGPSSWTKSQINTRQINKRKSNLIDVYRNPHRHGNLKDMGQNDAYMS